jgi:hypothetical protein
MENKKLISEITRIQEMMGVQVITEGKLLTKLEKYLLPSIEKLIKTGEKTVDKEMEQAFVKSLDNTIADASNPYSKKLEQNGIKTLEDLANLETKGFTKEEVEGITKIFLKKAAAEIEQNFPGLIQKTVDDAVIGSSGYKRMINFIKKTNQKWVDGVIPNEGKEKAQKLLDQLKKSRETYSNLSELSPELRESTIKELDDAINSLEQKLNGTFKKEVKGAVEDAATGELTQEASEEVQSALDEVGDVVIDESKLGDITTQPFTEEEVVKTVLPELESDMKLFQKGLWNSASEEMRAKWKLDVTKKTIQMTKDAVKLSDDVIKNNAKQLEAMEKIWANPNIDEAFKKKMIEESANSLGLKLSPKAWQWWKKQLLEGFGVGINKIGFKEYYKKFISINIIWSVLSVANNIIKASNSPGGSPSPIEDLDGWLAAYQPGEILIKTFTPFFLGRIVTVAVDLGTKEYRIPSSSEVQEYLAGNGVTTPSQYEYKNNEDAGTLNVYKGSDILGQFKYNNDKNKVEPFGELKPELTPSGGSNTNTGGGSTTPSNVVATADELKTYINQNFNPHPSATEWRAWSFTIDPSDKSIIKGTKGSTTITYQKQSDGSYKQK